VVDGDKRTTPDADYLTALEQLVTTFPAAIGHADLRMTLKECVDTARIFLYRHRGVSEPVAPSAKSEPPTPSPAPTPA